METSIEWLIDKLTEDSSKFLFLSDKPEYMNELIKIVKEAKAMERGQIIDAYWAGINDSTNEYSEAFQINSELIGINTGKGAEKYYNDTFKKI